MGIKLRIAKRKSQPRTGPGRLRRWWGEMDSERRRTVLRRTGWFALSLAALTGGAWGMVVLERRIVSHPRQPHVAVRVRLVDCPRWMPTAVVREVADGMLPTGANLNDPDLAEAAYKAASGCPWIRRVLSVEKKFTEDPSLGVLELRAEYRKPVARVLVSDGRGYAYVAADGHRMGTDVPRWMAYLTGPDGDARWAYFADPSRVPAGARAVPVHYMTVRGVWKPMPEVGGDWAADDLAVALRVVRLLWTKPYAGQVAEVDVSNYRWRLSKQRPQIRLVARRAGRPETTILFGRFSHPEGDWNVPVERKLEYLDRYVRLHGGNLAGVHWKINLQRHDDVAYQPYPADPPRALPPSRRAPSGRMELTRRS